MIGGIVEQFPVEWRTDVTVTRTGYDNKGNPLPPTSHVLPGCLVGWRTTIDPVDRSDVTTDDISIYINDPLADVKSTDTFTVPAGPWPSGKFKGDGKPKRWPLGLEVPVVGV